MSDLARLARSVLMPGFSGTTVPDWLAPHLSAGLGGVCLFAMNTPDLGTTRGLCDALKALNPDLCIAVDEEGGDVTRLQRVTGSALPGNEALGVVDDLDLTREVGAAIGRLVRAAGIDLDLAPCLDVASNRLNPVIGTRSFGADSERVAAHGRAWLDGLQAAGVGGCAKHFPGHGDTATDSHHALPRIDVSRQVLETRDFVPFAAVADRVDAMMTGHIVCSAFGDEAATISPWAYERIRGFGFEGPVITDAMGMRALYTDGQVGAEAGIGEACVRALEAGVDLCCLDSPHNRDEQATFDDAFSAVLAALESGRLDPEEVAAKARRVVDAVALVRERGAGTDLSAAQAEAGVEALGLEVARRALQVQGDVVLDGPIVFCDLRTKTNLASGKIGTVTMDALVDARSAVGGASVTAVDAAAIGDHAGASVVALTREPLGDVHEAAALAALLEARPDAVIVHAGMAQSAPEAARLICSHGLGRAVARATAEALVGRQVEWKATSRPAGEGA